MRTVREVAELAGVSVRALHYYDEIGLLKPTGRSESGYRLYSHDDVTRLQEIVAWRQLGFSLREVQELVDDPDHDRAAALRHQRTLAREQLTRAAALVDALDTAIAAHDKRQPPKEEAMFEGLSSMLALLIVDAEGHELGRCSINSRMTFEPGRSTREPSAPAPIPQKWKWRRTGGPGRSPRHQRGGDVRCPAGDAGGDDRCPVQRHTQQLSAAGPRSPTELTYAKSS